MKIKHTALTLFLAGALGLSAQNGTMTPYSAYGFGVLRDGATSIQRAMGGVGYAMNSGRQINSMNPASYAAVDSLTFLFDMGVTVTNMWQNETVNGTLNKDKNFGGGLDYVTMQFPICSFLGASIGLKPFSSVGYSFGSKIENGVDARQGSGSLNEVYAGLAGRPFGGFTIGVNISYLFGNILNDTYATISSTQASLFQKQLEVRDYHLTFGAQYSLGLRGTDRMVLGLVYSPQKTLLGHSRRAYIDAALDSEPQFSDEISLKNNYSLPETWGAGLSYCIDRKLTLEFDFTYQPWTKAKYRYDEDQPHTQSYANRTKYAGGLQYVPDMRGSYLRRVNYRLGVFLCDDYLKIRGNQLRQYGVTAGFGLPVPQLKTTVNLGLEWMYRHGRPHAMIKENYLNITLGINFNEMWFRQSKIY